jgi:hypothetical protein
MSVLPTLTHLQVLYIEKAVFLTPLIHRFSGFSQVPLHVAVDASNAALSTYLPLNVAWRVPIFRMTALWPVSTSRM